jgi:hypothetical protein
MALNKIKDLIYELDEVDADIEDIQAYANLVIENDLKINVDFTFYGEDSKPEPETEQASWISGFFVTSATYQTGASNKDQWSMVKTIDQAMMLRMFGIIIEDTVKKRQSIVNKLKRLGVNERATNTVKKN